MKSQLKAIFSSQLLVLTQIISRVTASDRRENVSERDVVGAEKLFLGIAPLPLVMQAGEIFQLVLQPMM